MKKVFSLILLIVMVVGLLTPVLALEGTENSITVYLSISENGEFVTSPVTNEKMAGVPIEISYFDLADYGLEAYYRYEADTFENGGAYINATVVEQPTLMHLFIQAVEDYYLGEGYSPENNADVLKFTGAATSAYADKFWAHDSNFTYLVDDKMPEMRAGWGASCDYILLEDGMEIEVGMFASWDWASGGTVASFGEKELTANKGGSLNFEVKGDPIYYGGSKPVVLGSDKIFVVKSSQLDWVNDDTAEYIFEADENGVFNVRFDEEGTFYVSAIDVNVGSEAALIAPGVCKVTVVEPKELPNYSGDWTSFRGNENNMGIVDALTPLKPASTSLKWAEKFTSGWMDSTTPPIIVNGHLYFAKNDRVLRVSTEDGSIMAESEALAGSIGYGTTSITYGGGMFYIPLGSGRVQALRADTLESVWVSEALGGQTINSITYRDGKIFCGTWISETAEGEYFCISVEDEDTNQKTETKECLWTISHTGGFYWAGAYAAEDFVVFGSDDGLAEGETGESVLYSVNQSNGEIIDRIEGVTGDIRSTIAYDEASDRIYFTTKGGKLCKLKVNSDGTFDDETFEALELGGASTVTPLVYEGLAYVGVAGSDQFESGGHGYLVIDANVSPMKVVASCSVPGYVQASALLSTAYFDITGDTYVYITYNQTPGGIYLLNTDKTNRVDEDGAAVVTIKALDLFVPEDDMVNWCLCSPICDSDGTLYYKNDSGYLIALTVKRISGNVVGGSSNTAPEEEPEEPEAEDAKPEEAPDENVGKAVDEGEDGETSVAVEFSDTKGHWAEEYINNLASMGVINGKTEATFAPDDKITRAEFVTLLYRLSGDAAENESLYADVPADLWCADAVSWAVKNSITTGTSDGTFSPNSNITREQAVTFIARYLEYKKIELEAAEGEEFADSSQISAWAKSSVDVIKNAGIISGKGDNIFAPSDNATRAETAKILVNLIGVIES